jgi:hypothetical protein
LNLTTANLDKAGSDNFPNHPKAKTKNRALQDKESYAARSVTTDRESSTVGYATCSTHSKASNFCAWGAGGWVSQHPFGGVVVKGDFDSVSESLAIIIGQIHTSVNGCFLRG